LDGLPVHVERVFMHNSCFMFSELFKFCPFIQRGLHGFAQVTNARGRFLGNSGVFVFQRCYYFFGPA